MNTKILQRKLTEVTLAVNLLRGSKELYFDEPISVKLSDFTSFDIYGLCVTTCGGLMIMNAAYTWDELEATDVNAGKLLESISQKIKLINNQKSAA